MNAADGRSRLDRQGLTEAVCECYRLVRARVAFHLPRHILKMTSEALSVIHTDTTFSQAHNPTLGFLAGTDELREKRMATAEQPVFNTQSSGLMDGKNSRAAKRKAPFNVATFSPPWMGVGPYRRIEG